MFTLREQANLVNENEIAYKALERLVEQTGIAGEFTPNANGVDGELDLYINHKKQHLFVEVKRELRQYQLPAILELAKQYQPLIIVAENIFPALKKILRDNKIGYLDTAGNIYLHTEDNYIWIDGNKPAAEKKKVPNRAFTKTGLKTVFYLLLHQDAVNMPYRKLAEATAVALGRDVWYSRGNKTFRQTKDVDLAILVGSQEDYAAVKKYLLENKGFTAIKNNSFVLLTPASVQVDILPFGEIETDNGVIITGTRLSNIKVNGFMEVYQRGTQAVEMQTGH